MAEMHVMRKGMTLAPCYDEDGELLAKMKDGVPYRLTYERERNLPDHRRLFALIKFVAERHPIYDNKVKALVAIKVAAGHVEFLPHPETGELMAIPKSINFREMKQVGFEKFYQNAVQGILDHLTADISRADLDSFVEEVCRF